MRDAAAGLGTQSGYSGYGAEQGRPELRKAVCDRFYASCGLKPEEVFISDGSKCDIGRLQMMFGKGVSVALQDPAYPVCVLFCFFCPFSAFFSLVSSSASAWFSLSRRKKEKKAKRAPSPFAFFVFKIRPPNFRGSIFHHFFFFRSHSKIFQNLLSRTKKK